MDETAGVAAGSSMEAKSRENAAGRKGSVPGGAVQAVKNMLEVSAPPRAGAFVKVWGVRVSRGVRWRRIT